MLKVDRPVFQESVPNNSVYLIHLSCVQYYPASPTCFVFCFCLPEKVELCLKDLIFQAVSIAGMVWIDGQGAAEWLAKNSVIKW